MLRSKGGLALAAAAVIAVTAALSTPADARKKKKQYRVDPTSRIDTAWPPGGRVPSLDGVYLGRERTCGYATFRYDGFGVPMGPYCR